MLLGPCTRPIYEAFVLQDVSDTIHLFHQKNAEKNTERHQGAPEDMLYSYAVLNLYQLPNEFTSVRMYTLLYKLVFLLCDL